MNPRRLGAVVLSSALIASTAVVLASPSATATSHVGSSFDTVPATVSAAPEPTTEVVADDAEYVEDEVLVTWSDDATASDQDRALDDAGLTADEPSVEPGAAAGPEVATIANGSDVAEVVADLKADPRVESVQPNYLYRRMADQYYGYQWGLNNTGQSLGAAGTSGIAGIDLDAPQAWAISKGSSSTVVAVLDTGIQTTHPDLADSIWVNQLEAEGNPEIDDDSNGYIDDYTGWDFANYNNTVYDGENCGGQNNDDHGTHVAGIIAARNDSVGTAGVAPNVTIMPLKILGCGDGETADLIKAINYAKEKGVKIVNLSLGGATYDPALYDAMASARKAGMLFIAAAGNGQVAGRYPRCYVSGGDPVSQCPMYPAAFNLDNIISVAAMTNRGALASFSQYGVTGPSGTSASGVDIAAPGYNILSTVPYGTGRSADATWGMLSGTSMAAPFVTGVAALVKSKSPSWTGGQIRSRVLNSGRVLNAAVGKTTTGRMVNAANALGRSSMTVVARPAAVTAGQAVLLGATLSSGVAMAGRTVQMQRYVPATKTWVADCTAVTRSDGTAWCRRYPQAHTWYRWQFVGDGYYRSVTTAGVRVVVKARVALSPSTSSTSLGRYVSFTSSVAPNHAGKTVSLQRLSGSRWVTVTSRPLSTSSKMAFSVGMTVRGASYWRTYFAGDADHAGGVSRSIRVLTS